MVLPDRLVRQEVVAGRRALTVGIVPVTAQLDLEGPGGRRRGKKARMAESTAAERATGYVAGGISPLGQRKRLPTVLDSSASAPTTVYCSPGGAGWRSSCARTTWSGSPAPPWPHDRRA